MKRNILIIIVIALALVCIGCGREKRGMLTQRGKEVHDSWLKYTQQIIEKTIVPAFQMDAWINGNDSVRRVIEDQYFPKIRIREEATNEYALYDGAQKVLTVTTNGLALADAGSAWIVSVNDFKEESNYGQAPEFMGNHIQWQIFINQGGNQQWNISLDTSKSKGSACDWQLTLPASDTVVYFSQKEFALAGNGVFRYAGNVSLRYNIDEMLQHQGTQYPWHRGVVSMTATNTTRTSDESSTGDIHVKAEYLGFGDMEITYRDVTETWEFEKK